MRFGIIYYGTEAKNRGLGQLCQSLIALGHKPYIVTRKPKSGDTINKFNGTPVIQLPKKDQYFQKYLNAPLPVNPAWKRWIIFLAKKYKWDGLFIRETPLAWPGIKAGRILGVPVFLDIRENLGAVYESNKAKKPFLKRLRRRWFVRLYENFVLPGFDHVFPSTQELGNWLNNDYGIESEKLSILGNYPSKYFLEQAETALSNKERLNQNNVLRLVHAGYVLENRGLQDIIKALNLINSQTDKVVLRIIGDGSYLENLKALVNELNIEQHVEFVPMLPPEKVAGELSACDIGVCSYFLNEQTHQTLPGKLFEYMSVGLPVLSSARASVVRIIEKHKCGVIYKGRNPEQIKELILKMANDRAACYSMGERGKEALYKYYNWQSNLKILDEKIQLYQK